MKIILLAFVFISAKSSCQTIVPATTESDTVKKSLVRFLQLNPRWPDVTHFSISLEKISSTTMRSGAEPVDRLGENNIITDFSSYNAVKQFINKHLTDLQRDTSELNYRSVHGSYEFVIDDKKIYYLKYDKADGFFAELVAYITISKSDTRIIDLIVHRE